MTSKKRVTILLVAPFPPPAGGIATWTRRLVRNSSVFENLKLLHIDTAVRWRAPTNKKFLVRIFGGSIFSVITLVTLVFIVFIRRPSMVHLVTSGSFGALRDLFCLTFAKFAGVPTVLHIRHGRFSCDSGLGSVPSVIEHFAFRISDRIVVLDHKTKSFLLGFTNKNKLSLIPNFIDDPIARSWNCQSEAVIRFIFVGWLSDSKGISCLLSAWDKLDVARLNCELLLIGPFQQAYLDRIKSRFSFKNVKVLGELSEEEVAVRMREARALVVPSRSEGFPNVVLEAMSVGLPVIATRVGAIPEILDREVGYLIEPNDVEGLIVALKTLATDISSALRYSAMGYRKVCESYSASIVLKKYEDLWNQLVKK